MGFFQQLSLLLWKNLLLQRRSMCVSIFEILIPLFFAVIILIVRFEAKSDETTYPSFYPLENIHQQNFTYRYMGEHVELGYVPNTLLATNLMTSVLEKFTKDLDLSKVNTSDIKGFDNEDELVSYFRLNSDKMQLAVVFEGLGQAENLPREVTYYIRPMTGEDTEWYTGLTYPFLRLNVPSTTGPDYTSSGVLLLQVIVGEVLIQTWSNRTFTFDLRSQKMPFPPYIKDPIIMVLDTTFPLLLMLSFILSVVANTKSIVYEKEHKLKESMKLMGLIPAAHWVSWFITCYVYLAVAMAIYAVLFGVNIIKSKGAVLTHSNPGLFFLFLLLYAAAIVSFCFMVSVLVQKANVASALAGMLFFAFYFPNFFLASRYQEMTKAEKIGACFLFNMAMSFGAKVFSLSEGTGEGARWDNFYKPASVDDDFCLLDAMVMLLADTVLHLLITWYIENVRPGNFGVPRPFYFPFTSAYWCGSQPSKSESYESPKGEEDIHFEREPTDFEACIRICKLRKKYSKNKVAVESMNLTMYRGQITVLLGHNGAGKTTTMSMLTGFETPSSGTAYINGLDIRTDMNGIRQSLGLCPQHNILFGTLTVQEHLTFFARLKGCPRKDVQQEVERTIKEVGLEAKVDARAATLSGGQKRKLSVGIALINGSRVVILDEPTSGMDPAARRQTWDVLKKQREGRCMLLTTHYMDEADVLGDRIAIMAEGVVKCCGSSLFLKKLYGAGYHLVLVKAADCKVSKITDTIQSFLPSARFESEVNMELSYLLPADQSHVFPTLFTLLEDKKEELRILSFGATATTMEEVFLRVGQSAVTEEGTIVNKAQIHGGHGGHTNPAFLSDQTMTDKGEHLHFQTMSEDAENTASDILGFTRGYTKSCGRVLQLARLKALLVKKAIHFWRNRIITIAQLLLPVVFTILALSIEKAKSVTISHPALEWSLERFSGTHILYSASLSGDNVSEALATAYETQFDASQIVERMALDSSTNLTSFLLEREELVGIASFNKKFIVGAEFAPSSAADVMALALYNGQPYHSKPTAVHYVLNTLVRTFVGAGYKVKAGIHPLPARQDIEAKQSTRTTSQSGFSIGLVLSFGMAFLTTMFIYFLIVERTCGAKHLQVMSGVRPVMYWLSNLLWDYTNYLLACLAVLAVFAGFAIEVYVGENRLGLIFLILLLYGWAVLPLMYLAHFFFSSGATGVVVVIVFNIFSGVITMVVVFVLRLPDLGLEYLSKRFDWAFLCLFPNHCLSRSFMDMYTNKRNQDICTANSTLTAKSCLLIKGPCCRHIGKGCPDDICLEYTDSFFSWEEPGIGRFLTFLAVQGVVYFCVMLLVEHRVLQGIWECMQCGYSHRLSSVDNQRQFSFLTGSAREDSDVAEERRRINASPASVLSQKDSLLLVNLYKTFRNFAAVDHVCLGVPEHECFGLLGQNGAGKTTIFKMLTGDVNMTGGNGYLKGFDIKSSLKKVQANMGYCPQFDAVLNQMTGRETLTMYARLRGVPEKSIRGVVNSLIDILMLRPHADKLTGHYSGGNKRKLSTAIALIGDPPFLMLDEPSSGMDPAARRQLWTVLSKVRASGRTLVLTSHSMEECDALCTRIAIMVNGNFLCLGSPQHLKSKFGQGYSLVAQMAVQSHGVPTDYAPLVSYLQACCPNARVFDCHQGYVHVQVPDPWVKLADVFSWMEHSKIYFGVQDYSVHQTTLEQIFLAFTRAQVPPRKKKKKKCSKSKCCCLCCCC